MLKINWDEMDKQEIAKSVVLLDLFAKIFCRYINDYERFDDLKFRCDECPFQKENGDCLVKSFKNKYAPDYRDFGSMGDLKEYAECIDAFKEYALGRKAESEDKDETSN